MSSKAAKKPQQRSKAKSAPQRVQTAMSREARGAYAELQQGMKQLQKSIGEIQRGLLKAEAKIEADARARIRELRKDAHTHVSVLKSKQRDAAAALKHVSTAASGSWEEIKRMVDSVLADIRATASSVVERFRSAFGG